MNDQVTIARVAGVVDAFVDDQLVVLSPKDFSYHALDPVGAKIWELLAEPRTFGSLIDTLVDHYRVDADSCRLDTSPFVNRMMEIGVIVSVG